MGNCLLIHSPAFDKALCKIWVDPIEADENAGRMMLTLETNPPRIHLEKVEANIWEAEFGKPDFERQFTLTFEKLDDAKLFLNIRGESTV